MGVFCAHPLTGTYGDSERYAVQDGAPRDGLEKLVEDVERFDLNLTCANIISKGVTAPSVEPSAGLQESFGTVFPPYLVVERNGVRFGFVGLLAPETKSRKVGAEGEIEALT